MRKVFSILLLFLCVTAKTQNHPPPIYEITLDTIDQLDIAYPYVQLLSDKKGTGTIEQVRTLPLTNLFAPTPTSFNYFSIHTHQQRIRLHNATAKEAKIAFFNYHQQVDYYIGHLNGRWHHFQGGWSVPWSRVDGLKKTTYSFIPIVLQPDETAIVYRRTYNSYRIPYFTSGFVTGTTDKVVQDWYINDEPEFITAIRKALNFGFCLFCGPVQPVFLLHCLGTGVSLFFYLCGYHGPWPVS